jgi:hypothetical protein
VRLLGRYQGRNGAIEIVECSADGTRIYFEEGVRQSQATPDGESVFSYVKLMDELLHRAFWCWDAAAGISPPGWRVSEKS